MNRLDRNAMRRFVTGAHQCGKRTVQTTTTFWIYFRDTYVIPDLNGGDNVQIPGAEKVVSIFGRWPSFHDAEVVRFVLERSDPYANGPSIFADVHAFEMTSEIAADGTYVLKHH